MRILIQIPGGSLSFCLLAALFQGFFQSMLPRAVRRACHPLGPSASCSMFVPRLRAEPAVGLEGVRQARGLTRKPLVAIGGITRENVAAVMAAGADSVAVIGGLFTRGESVGAVVRDFLRQLR